MEKRVKFLNCQIDLTKKVFQPRIETEFWVKKAIGEIKKEFKNQKKLKILDIFAGTGCIGISVLKFIKNSQVDFADISKEAIEAIRINLKLNLGKNSKSRYRIFQSNLFKKIRDNRYEIIFANPPYVALARISEVDKNVLEKEPRDSLFAGRDGMFWIKRFLREVKHCLKENGIFYLEFDSLQKEKIKEILEKESFEFSLRKDQFKKYRWLKAKVVARHFKEK